MTARGTFLINPDPVMTPASNPHRAGASNHHQTGSGENPMVGTTPSAHRAVDRATGQRPGSTTMMAIYRRVYRDTARFLWTDDQTGETAYSPWSLAELVAAIVTDHTTVLRAELDAANDAVVELIGQLEETTAASAVGAAGGGR